MFVVFLLNPNGGIMTAENARDERQLSGILGSWARRVAREKLRIEIAPAGTPCPFAQDYRVARAAVDAAGGDFPIASEGTAK